MKGGTKCIQIEYYEVSKRKIGEREDGQMQCETAAWLYLAGTGSAFGIVYPACLDLVPHFWSRAYRGRGTDV